MKRIPEPELKTSRDQVLAYSKGDFIEGEILNKDKKDKDEL